MDVSRKPLARTDWHDHMPAHGPVGQMAPIPTHGWAINGLGAAALGRATPRGDRQDAAKRDPELTSRRLSLIGAHYSGCLLGGPFSFYPNVKA
jgi:hypothetical protein